MTLSLRARLTIAYALAIAFGLAAIGVVFAQAAFGVLAQPVLRATDDAAADARALVARERGEKPSVLEQRVHAIAGRPGVVVLLRPPGSSAPRHHDNHDLPGDRLSLRAFLGLTPRVIAVPGGNDVLVAPDLQQLRGAIAFYVQSLVAVVLTALAVGWLAGRWIAKQALAPLLTVTAELERFAAGDLRPNAIDTGDRSELGALARAYNGAARQVAAALDERASAEAQMRRFIADAGHELRTPLTAISGFVDVLRNGGALDPAIRDRALATLRVETQRMRRLLERLMALARLERSPALAELESCDAGRLAADAIEAVVGARDAEVRLHVADPRPLVLADRGELHEAMTNLIDNALKHGAQPVDVAVGREDGHIVVRVADAGDGIPEAERERIFERFFRGSAASGTEGSGLGLAIVRRAAARCGAAVRLESSGSGRTVFSLALPAP